MAQLFNDTPDRQDLGAISIGSRSRQFLKKKFRKNIKSSLSYENFKISKVGDFFFRVFLEFGGIQNSRGSLPINLGSITKLFRTINCVPMAV